VGQYTASPDGKNPGYLVCPARLPSSFSHSSSCSLSRPSHYLLTLLQDDKTVPKGSKCPTFATAVAFVNNARWHGTSFYFLFFILYIFLLLSPGFYNFYLYCSEKLLADVLLRSSIYLEMRESLK
jgi:hypothetical protein